MSVASDDTDVLLFIPPDFFMVPSDSEEESFTFSRPSERLLVNDLISQVNDLEGRICMIENQDIFNSCKMSFSGNLQNLRHFGSADALNTSCKTHHNSRSLQTTPMKSQTMPSPSKNYRACNFSPNRLKKSLEHQNILMSTEYVNQKEKDDQLLEEIHKFFKNKQKKINAELDISETVSVQEKPSLKIEETDHMHLSTAVFNLDKVNNLLKQLEDTQTEIEQKLKLTGLEAEDIDKSSTVAEKKTDFNKSQPSDSFTKNSLEKKNTKRLLNFDSLSPEKHSKSVEPKQEILKTDISDFGLELDLNSPDSEKQDNEMDKKNRESIRSKNESNDLVSLCKLWGNNIRPDDGIISDDIKIVRQKYQEEKCRRLHCENLIQKLQSRLLEEQQKIVVAMKVDEEKDQAISKLTEGWNKLVNHWKDLENQRNDLENKLQSEREKFEKEVAAAYQTVKRYETELSKALDLAHGYKEKCEACEKEKKVLVLNYTNQIDTLKSEKKDTNDKLQNELIQVEKFEKLLASRDSNLNIAKSKIIEAQNQIRELKKNCKDQQTELEAARFEKEKLHEKLKEEKCKISSLEHNKKVLLQSNEELKKKEKSLKENIKSLSEQMEKVKLELKDFYQDQVEKIVQEKLKEFQGQLTNAERTLQKEIEEREKNVTEMAVKQVQQIVEKHVVEVNILEEKHKEEIELWKIKVIRAEERIVELQKKLDLYSNHKTEIAQKLQSIMENQWQEVLKIIANTGPQIQKSPISTCRSNPDKELTRSNTFTMTSCGPGDGILNKNGLPPDAESRSLSPIIESPFCQEGQITFRDQLKSAVEPLCRIDETPEKIDTETVHPLRKYIQMLLERPPGLPVDESLDNSLDTALFSGITESCDPVQWQQILSEHSSLRAIKPIEEKDVISLKEKKNIYL